VVGPFVLNSMGLYCVVSVVHPKREMKMDVGVYECRYLFSHKDFSHDANNLGKSHMATLRCIASGVELTLTEPSYQNESSDFVSRKPLDGFKNAFNTK